MNKKLFKTVEFFFKSLFCCCLFWPVHVTILSVMSSSSSNKILLRWLLFVNNYASLFQGELIVGDQSGAIHMWDLKTDHNEQLVRKIIVQNNIY